MATEDEGEIALRAEYVATMLYYPDARAAEYVARDCACYYEEIGDGAALVRDMDSREIIGFRIRDPEAWAKAVASR